MSATASVLSCCAWLALGHGTTQEPQPRTYIGALAFDDRRFEIGLRFDAPESAPRVDLVSCWWLDAPVEGFAREGQRISFRLPLELGACEAEFAGERLEGHALLADGRRASLSLGASPAPLVRSEDFALEVEGAELAGTLGLPAGPGPFPALVFVHGGGDASRANPATRFLSEYLPRFGIACLVCDKRGCGESSGSWKTIDFETTADDVVRQVRALRKNPAIQAEHIGLYAGSQGCWVAPLAAAREPAIRFLVQHSGPLVSPYEADAYAIASSLRAKGLEEAVMPVAELWRLECQALREGVAPARFQPLLAAIADARKQPWFAAAPYEATPEGNWWLGWYGPLLDHDPLPTLRALAQPMLWLFGANDTQSDPVRNAELVAELARAGKPYDVHVFPNAGHGIMGPVDRSGHDRGPLAAAPGYFELLTGWILRQSR
ncbi:MAG: alpha/beta fold hydrolase [Planctomycetes bacterium]|nr:alpha/beta fold hydrolase [Planctomycetota bacterium]